MPGHPRDGKKKNLEKMRLAGGISIRFPRVTKIREDKSPDTATNLQELQHLYAASKQHVDFQMGELPSLPRN
jgi:DNA ligase-3